MSQKLPELARDNMFTFKQPEEYYGRLFYKSSGTVILKLKKMELLMYTSCQLCLDNAVLWFKKDKCGGWSELQLKLGNNDLEMRVAKVPSDRSGLKELVADLVQSCTSQGARDLGSLDKALTFTEQVSILKEKGLIGSNKPDPPPSSAPSMSSEEQAMEQAMIVAHRTEV